MSVHLFGGTIVSRLRPKKKTQRNEMGRQGLKNHETAHKRACGIRVQEELNCFLDMTPEAWFGRLEANWGKTRIAGTRVKPASYCPPTVLTRIRAIHKSWTAPFRVVLALANIFSALLLERTWFRYSGE
jgi:hypothetical protein